MDRAAILQPLHGMPVPQIVKPEEPKLNSVLSRPYVDPAYDSPELTGEILVAFAVRVPEQQWPTGIRLESKS